MEGALTAADLEKLASLIGAYSSKRQPEEEDEDDYEEDEYDYRAVKAENDLAFHPDKYYYGVNFRTMILDPNIFTLPWWWPISRKYVKKLQYCLEQARLFIKINHLENVEDLKTQCEDLRTQVIDLERQLASAKGEAESAKKFLEMSMNWQSTGGIKNMVAEAAGLAPIVEDKSADQERNKGGKFAAKGIGKAKEMTGLQKKMAAAAYNQTGCTLDDISTLLGVGVPGLRGYVSEMKKHWRYAMCNVNGVDETYLHFDADCGNEDLFLSDYSPEKLAERIAEKAA